VNPIFICIWLNDYNDGSGYPGCFRLGFNGRWVIAGLLGICILIDIPFLLRRRPERVPMKDIYDFCFAWSGHTIVIRQHT